ncbi:MAG: hypothetical protein HY369_04765 [Candidatus Aenigmarchaeota archaeon]|nr:hypothetical protein [Candidatus Aenigmarchaeota archaeon]
MSVERLLRDMEAEVERLKEAVDDFFSPGMDKYTAYAPFTEAFAIDPLVPESDVPALRLENQEGDRDSPESARNYRPPLNPYPGIEIRRVAGHELGYGILGRCFPYSGLIEIRSDLYGEEFAEVLTHELTHMASPQLSELDVRVATRMKLPFSPKWH